MDLIFGIRLISINYLVNGWKVTQAVFVIEINADQTGPITIKLVSKNADIKFTKSH